jgi:tRNA pseudouridine55 synthase
MNGILLINKDSNMTSFDVVRQLKRKLNLDKIGHAGTLDPFATGLLVILVGKATKLSNYWLNQNKTYEVEIAFGAHTDTYDIDGNVLRTTNKIPTIEQIQQAMTTLTQYDQQPPMYSAIKIKGQKLVDLARKGIDVPRELRPVEIYQSTIISYKEGILKLVLEVSKGTYIRSYAVDLAKALLSEAHVRALKRLRSGNFSLEDAVSVEEVDMSHLVSLDMLMKDLPSITVSPYIASRIKQGMVLDQRQFQRNTNFIVKDENGALIALYEPFNADEYRPVFTL